MSGEPVQKTITVVTSDPEHEKLVLTISGRVNPAADLSSAAIRLTGSAGSDISKTVTIAPVAENPFRITTVRAENGTYFRHELVTKETPDGNVTYDLTVHNLKKEKGWYTDKLFIDTDSAVSPVLEIPVLGFIREGL